MQLYESGAIPKAEIAKMNCDCAISAKEKEWNFARLLHFFVADHFALKKCHFCNAYVMEQSLDHHIYNMCSTPWKLMLPPPTHHEEP